MKNETPKYSRQKFDGFTHRFIVQFETGDEYPHNIDIYSDCADISLIESYVSNNKSKNVLSVKIIHRPTKQQDELSTEFINELFKD